MKEELIGRSVQGFKFGEPYDYEGGFMDEYIGADGKIIGYENFDDLNYYEVEFEDGESWFYPAEFIEEYLLNY